MEEIFWTSLLVAIQHAQCVLVLGSEFDAVQGSNARGNSDSVLEELRLRLTCELEAKGQKVHGESLAAVAQQFEDFPSLGSRLLRPYAAQFLEKASGPIPEAYNALARLPFPLVLTTCQDDLFAKALRTPGTPGKSPSTYFFHLRGDQGDNPELAPYGCEAPAIYHLFGHYQEPNSLVLSENDLLDFVIKVAAGRPKLPNNLKRALQKAGQSLLFVGFGIRHWYLRVLLKALLRVLEFQEVQSGGGAFALEPLGRLSRGDAEQTVLFYRRGTRVEVVDEDVDEFIGQLTERFVRAGGFKGSRSLADRRARVFVSYASEDESTAERISAALVQARLQPWFDKDALQGGDYFDHVIKDQLRDTDFVIVLHSRNLAAKRDSYVNREIALALERATSVRGSFVIPLLIDDLPEDEWVGELRQLHQDRVRSETFEADMQRIVSLISREFQVRHR